jgi:FKBP-type peptidyl-prolyl cis-trans isomerase/parvulin-like peptidyl-prolyl isomerase
MKIAKSILAIALSLLMAVAFIGCQKDPDTGVAATVGSAEVLEADVTALMEYYRIDENTGAARENAAWATYIASASIPATWTEFFKARGYDSATFTPEIMREWVIRNNFGLYALMIQKAAEKGITADQANLDAQMESIRSSANSEGVTIEDYIRARGFASESSYRVMLEAYAVSDELARTLVAAPTQAELDQYIRENVAMYTGKRISIIALAVDETNTEDAVRTKMNNAKTKLDQGTAFADVAKEVLPENSELLATGGDLGWGYESSMPEEIATVLDTLEKDQLSGVIEVRSDTAGTAADTSDDTVSAMYIVKYTDTFELPETENTATAGSEDLEGVEDLDTTTNADLDLSIVPADLKEELSTMAAEDKLATEQTAYWTEMAQSDEIVVNAMPSGLSYAVDMSLATPADSSTTDDGTTEDGSEALTPVDSDEAVSAAELAGLQITDTTVGTGAEVKSGDKVEVYYTGTLSDGTEFDSNVGSGSPLPVTVGAGGVIDGWDQGLVGMKVGGTRQLVIPPSLAYGSDDYSDIPGNSILTFEIQLVSVNGDSTGYVSPTEGADSAGTALE